MFRELSNEEAEQFRQWARANHKRGEPINSVWHPVVQAECLVMDREPSPDVRTLAQLAREALQVQDACNLSGVVHGWSRSISRLRALLTEAGTKQINEHPISQLWADKVAHLTATQFESNWSTRAYRAVYEMAEAEASGGAASGGAASGGVPELERVAS